MEMLVFFCKESELFLLHETGQSEMFCLTFMIVVEEGRRTRM